MERIMEKYEIEKEVIEIRRHIHENPELSENEYETIDYICSKLDEYGIPYIKGVAKTGVVATIEGSGQGKCVAIRGDIDALPISEETGLEFASKNPGVMHACGHDCHGAIVLAAGRALSLMKDQFKGTVKLLFQPAEETVGGAERMIEEGCLKNPEVDYVLGLHVEPSHMAGEIGIKYGKTCAASDMIDVTVRGKSSHGAHPEEGADAIIAAAGILNAVQTAVSRNLSPLNSAVCTFGRIEGGNARNQIADEVVMKGIIRTLDPETRVFVRNKIESICKAVGSGYGAEVEVNVAESYGPLINTDSVSEIVEKNAVELIGRDKVVLVENPDLGAEDFSYFASAKPSCFFRLGCYSEKLGPRRDLHSSRFTVDEDCLILGVKLQVKNVLALLEE